ncbi:hypothetical protein HMN09_00853900 [Mycena chlorophos]|uniref:Uncharacterized protein n=1 Tax=Mycena chlorophos TaxID=658473 RepID=A0A8H6SRG5_MYCCL|nr:hypothetical protein HMN09_00853900 [Mycena chlorophos]
MPSRCCPRLEILALISATSTLAAAQNPDGDDDDGTHIEGTSSSSFAMVGAVIGGILLLIALIALVGYGVGRWLSRRRDKQARFAPLPTYDGDQIYEPYRPLATPRPPQGVPRLAAPIARVRADEVAAPRTPSNGSLPGAPSASASHSNSTTSIETRTQTASTHPERPVSFDPYVLADAQQAQVPTAISPLPTYSLPSSHSASAASVRETRR